VNGHSYKCNFQDISQSVNEYGTSVCIYVCLLDVQI
jgi:hypothetical protein